MFVLYFIFVFGFRVRTFFLLFFSRVFRVVLEFLGFFDFILFGEVGFVGIFIVYV